MVYLIVLSIFFEFLDVAYVHWAALFLKLTFVFVCFWKVNGGLKKHL